MLLLQVRFGTLKVLQELYTKLGEEMVVLLPETTPYLYELMEGESCSEPMCPEYGRFTGGLELGTRLQVG